MRMIRFCSLAGLALLAACGGGDAPADEAAQDTGMPGAMMPGDSMMAMPHDSGMAGMPDSAMAGGAHVALNAVGGSTASGMAMMTGTELSLSVTGAPASAALQAHVHRGRCGNDQGVAAPLSPITAGADGSGSSTTTLDSAAVSGEKFVQVHGAGGTPILCGDLPASGS
jgi:hypothetical protein